MVDVGNHCLPRSSHFITVNSSLPRTSELPPPVPTDPSLKCHQDHQKQMRKYLRMLLRNVRRENISDNSAQISFCSVWNLVVREMPKNGEHDGQIRIRLSKMLSPPICLHNSPPQICRHYQKICHLTITPILVEI